MLKLEVTGQQQEQKVKDTKRLGLKSELRDLRLLD